MRNKILVTALAMISPALASADTFGIWVGANAWQQDWSGVAQSGTDVIDLNSDLGLEDKTNNNFFVALEHPIPILPNIRLQQTDMKISANNAIPRDITFEDVTFPAGTNVDSTVDLTHTDATLYYEILDNWISLDIGLTARLFSEGVEIKSNNPLLPSSAALKIDGTMPLLYGMVKFELPITGLYISARGNGISYSGDSLLDIEANVGYEFGFGLGLEAGYRQFKVDYKDDNNESADLTVDGTYIGIFYHL